MAERPRVLFVCVRNAGKSQMAAGLLAARAGDRVAVDSAGTRPGREVNPLSAASLLEVGVDITGGTPQPVTEELLRRADLVVTLGREAQLDEVAGPVFENWDVDEPSARGIEGLDRMRLIRDDITRRVEELATRLT